jgi:hypothetical protein
VPERKLVRVRCGRHTPELRAEWRASLVTTDAVVDLPQGPQGPQARSFSVSGGAWRRKFEECESLYKFSR